jgi:O-antigen/teichoic acid export membrane protein
VGRAASLAARVRGTSFSSVLLNAASLLGSNLISAALGVVYWPLAARSFSTSEVGTASAALAATMLLGGLSALGTTTLLVAELPRQNTIDRGRLVVTAVLVTALAGAVFGLSFSAVAPLLSPELRDFAGQWGATTIVVLMVSATAVGSVIDHALIGLLRGEVQFARNTVLAVAKLVALLVVAGLPPPNRGLALFSTWVAGTLVSFVVVIPLAGLGQLPLLAYKPKLEALRNLGLSALKHHVLNLSLGVPGSVLPLIVTVLLSATANAYFYVAAMFAQMVYLAPLALSTSLYAVSSHEPAALVSRTRLTLLLSMLAALLANIFVAVAAPPILALLGRGYVDEVYWVLRVLLLAAFPIVIKMHFVTLCQVKRLVGKAAIVVLLGGFAEIIGASVGGLLGDLRTLTIGYVLVIWAEGILLAPIVLRLLSARGSDVTRLQPSTADHRRP